MILKVNVLPKQYEALSIVLKAMKIQFEVSEAEEAYEKKVQENLLKTMLQYEKEGLEISNSKQTNVWLNTEKVFLGI